MLDQIKNKKKSIDLTQNEIALVHGGKGFAEHTKEVIKKVGAGGLAFCLSGDDRVLLGVVANRFGAPARKGLCAFIITACTEIVDHIADATIDYFSTPGNVTNS